MKKKCFLVLLLSVSISLLAQINNPVKWSFLQKEIALGEFELQFKATIEQGWHLYSMDIEEGGPIKTSFAFDSVENATLEGTVQAQDKEIRKMDALFGMEIGYFENEAVFTQRVKANQSTKITGYIEYMSCNDGSCTPPQEETFEFQLNVKAPAEPIKTEEAKIAPAVKSEKTVVVPSKVVKKEESKVVSEPKAVVEEEKVEEEVIPQELKIDTISQKSDIENNSLISENEVVVQSKPEEDHMSLWAIFFIAFGSGFLALLTPCVFPMIPMTVSYFTKQSKTKAKGIKNATIYGVFIVFIYVILGSLVTIVFGADALNALSTNPWFNVFFFFLLAIFAISFLGAFDITLPSSWVNKADKGADKGGLVGIFFMALTLALVSFSCTGPIVGTLLVQAASTGGLAPAVGMLGFGAALALPFALFAAFPGYLNSLPKSGGWLNSVKVVLGFIELALAFKFLSNADLVLDLHILEREVFIAIWIVCFGALGFYLLGKLRLPHDSPMETVSVGRLLFGLLVLAFTLYMVPGLWGAPLKLISAFPPPMEYAESPNGVGYRISKNDLAYQVTNNDFQKVLPDASMEIGPQNIPVFHDYDLAFAYAKKVGKPLFIDFTGKACVNCRQMEINVWSDPEVNALMKNDFVVAALYVDYREKLPEKEQYISTYSGKKIRTEGQKWSDFQISRYGTNSQPYYVMLDHEGLQLNEARAFDLDIVAYKEWLEKGLSQFNK